MRRLFAALVVVAAAVLVPACHQINDYPQQPKMTQPPTAEKATIIRHAVKDIDEIAGRCNGHTSYGCALVIPDMYGPGHNHCEVWLVEPTGPDAFNDVPKLAIAGHETYMHCFGAKHE